VRRQVVKDYGIFMEQAGFGTRATFVIDKEGRITHVEQGNTAIDPSGALQACSIFDRPKKTEN
jgi:peroxiredoxin